MNKSKAIAKMISETIKSDTGLSCYSNRDTESGIEGFKIWFDDFSHKEGLIVRLCAEGLHRHRVRVYFGRMAEPLLNQIQAATDEQVSRAIAFASLANKHTTTQMINFGDSSAITKLNINSCLYECERAGLSNHLSTASFEESTRSVLSPIMSAIAELIGYEEQNTRTEIDFAGDKEGAISISLVRRRERSPRNRMLCLRIHGEICMVCKIDLKKLYGDLGSIIEVHHIHPVGILESEITFNPKTDLIPLCPNCHSAIHTKRPIPWTPEELKSRFSQNNV